MARRDVTRRSAIVRAAAAVVVLVAAAAVMVVVPAAAVVVLVAAAARCGVRRASERGGCLGGLVQLLLLALRAAREGVQHQVAAKGVAARRGTSERSERTSRGVLALLRKTGVKGNQAKTRPALRFSRRNAFADCSASLLRRSSARSASLQPLGCGRAAAGRGAPCWLFQLLFLFELAGRQLALAATHFALLLLSVGGSVCVSPPQSHVNMALMRANHVVRI